MAVPPAATAAVRVEFVESGGRTVVEARGLASARLEELGRQPPTAAGWSELLAVYTGAAAERPEELPPLIGEYALTSTAVRFTPRFPLSAGETYVARFRDRSTGAPEVTASFAVPRPSSAPSTVVTAIYPSAAEVPENLLRVYVEFSAPMSRGTARHHIRLVDETGVEVDGPFVAPERELWSPDHTRLTLFFDPGRIKRGVGPNVEVGPPMREGRSYRLLVDDRLHDARGLPLARGHEKAFRTTGPDRDQPTIQDWLIAPPAGPAEPVTITFPEPLDRGLLEGLLEVLDESGESLDGEITVSHGETRWSFLPRDPWGSEVYRVRVAAQLEDLAGNSLLRPFEIALAGGTAPPDRPRYVELPFSRR